MSDAHARIDAAVDGYRHELERLALDIHADPELSYAEQRAVGRIRELVERHGGLVEQPLGGLETSFRARLGDGSSPHVAILAEYDALPEVGHACGHNLIAAAAAGAWLALAPLRQQTGGTVDLVGTPAEEKGGGKIQLLRAGVFAQVDAALMFHPFDRDLTMHETSACATVTLTFRGRASHAAMAPELGRSALTACMDTFRLIDGQRSRLPRGARVHGIISEGGGAPNIVVERAVASFSLRGRDGTELDMVRTLVDRCARGAALASEVDFDIEEVHAYRELRSNPALGGCFGDHLRALGRRPVERDPAVGVGSTDMGDVSQAIPALHPWLAICPPGEAACHQRRFAELACAPPALDTMVVAAKAIARTAFDVLADPSLRQRVKQTFEGSIAGA